MDTCIFFIEGVCISIISEARRQADEQKDEFISTASHELRNPLTAAKVLIQLVNRTAKQQKKKAITEYTGKIEIQLTKAINLISDLLDLSRIQTGKLTYHDEEFSIDELVKQIVSQQQLVQDTHKLQLAGSSKTRLFGDKQRIEQVIENLITNAIKYSPKAHTVRIVIRDKTSGVEVAVKDYGVGIHSQDIKKIFRRFYRTRSAEQHHFAGLGLGLHIASQIVKRHHGKLSVVSAYGKGTTFSVYFPEKKVSHSSFLI